MIGQGSEAGERSEHSWIMKPSVDRSDPPSSEIQTDES